MSDAHAHPQPNYMAVFYTLFAVTVAEVAIVYVPMPTALLISILMVMALFKAGMVALYFMHLKYDHKVLTVIAATPLLLVAIAVAVVAYEFASNTPTEQAARSNAPVLDPHGMLKQSAK
jgi:cytochrome c oxidase subunit 4